MDWFGCITKVKVKRRLVTSDGNYAMDRNNN